MLTGATLQLVTGLLLTGLVEMRLADDPDMAVDHIKIAVKTTLAVIIFVVALVAYRKQKKLSGGGRERKLLPLLHTAGALAIANTVIAVIWPGVVS